MCSKPSFWMSASLPVFTLMNSIIIWSRCSCQKSENSPWQPCPSHPVLVLLIFQVSLHLFSNLCCSTTTRADADLVLNLHGSPEWSFINLISLKHHWHFRWHPESCQWPRWSSADFISPSDEWPCMCCGSHAAFLMPCLWASRICQGCIMASVRSGTFACGSFPKFF